jgi:hypothetical protein
MPEKAIQQKEYTREEAENQYQKKSRIFINFLDEETSSSICEQEIITGLPKTPYVSPHGLSGKAIQDYTFLHTTGAPISGLHKKEDQQINYIYKKNKFCIGVVIIQFLDICTGKLLAPTKTLTGFICTPYCSPYGDEGKDIPCYKFIKHCGAPIHGKFKPEPQTITYLYCHCSRCCCCHCCPPKKGEVRIRFINQENNEAIAATEILKGNIGSNYSSPYGTTGKNISGFKLVKITGAPLNGTFGPVTKTINYIYKTKTPPKPQPSCCCCCCCCCCC